MIHALLLDLDNTLLGNDMGTFLPAYFQALGPYLVRIGQPREVIGAMMAAVRRIGSPEHPGRLNDEVFLEEFCHLVGSTPDQVTPIFEEFYRTGFDQLRRHVQLRPQARALAQWALEYGYQIVVATNPMFPTTAIQQRMAWAGLADIPFTLITSIESCTSCKPLPAYYREVVGKLGRQPSEALMVGDDWKMDIVPAVRAGLRTFWITDGQAAPSETGLVDGSGTLGDFFEWLRAGLPGLSD